jgi:hypothetical protein
LASVTTRRFVIFKSSQGDLYGRVADGRFDLRAPSSTRGNMIWVIGRRDPDADHASGTLRIIPDPIGSASFAVIVVAAIAIQFVPAGWFRAVLPAFAVAIAVIGVLVARVEWRAIVDRLQSDLGVTASAQKALNRAAVGDEFEASP